MSFKNKSSRYAFLILFIAIVLSVAWFVFFRKTPAPEAEAPSPEAAAEASAEDNAPAEAPVEIEPPVSRFFYDAGEDDAAAPLDVPLSDGEPGTDYPAAPEDVSACAEANEDFVCLLSVPALSLTYPVTWRFEDNEYYLEHDFTGTYRKSGTVFLDGWSDPSLNHVNSILFGHNMADGSVFGSLKRLHGNPSLAAEQPFVYLYGTETVKKYEIFAFYVTDEENAVYDLPEMELTEEMHAAGKYGRTLHDAVNRWYDAWLSNAEAASEYAPAVRPDFSRRPRTLMLSTCYGGLHGPERFVVHAVLTAEYRLPSQE